MNIQVYPFAVIIMAVMAGCGASKDQGTEAQPAPPVATAAPVPEATPEAPVPAIDVSTLAMKLDPVCKMSLEEYPATSTAEHAGKSYGFCSDFCKRKFVEAPDAILARFAESAAADEAKP